RWAAAGRPGSWRARTESCCAQGVERLTQCAARLDTMQASHLRTNNRLSVICASGAVMIDLYYWTTPNGHKITLFLEETGLPYRIHPINIGRGDQFDPAFLAISPNNRIPAIVDHDPGDGQAPLSLFESGAILLYLAEKTHAFIPADPRGRAETLQWLFWQMGGLGPMAGQNHHFSQYAPEKIPYAIDRYVRETGRLYGVLDRRLADREF